MSGGVIGKGIARVDAVAKVKGEARYPADFYMEGMLHGKVVWSEYPHARILEIDASRALAVPGVVAVLTHRDVPVNEYGIIRNDQHVLAQDIVRCVGEPVALVIAETEAAADAGRGLVRVEYEPLPVVCDPVSAMSPTAPLVHAERGTNILAHHKIRKGDIRKGFAEADFIVEGTYRTPHVEHAYLQPEAGLGYIDEEGRVTVVAAGQWAYDDRRQIAHALALPEDRVRVVVPYIGGAFGGREDVSLQILVALATWRTRRPFRLVWTREESIRGHGKRHPFIMRHRWGATSDGRLVAAEIEIIADAGAYASTSEVVLANAVSVATGPYVIPHLWIDGYAVHTNNLPTMAMRGFGATQPAVAYELQMDKLARALELDPVEIRLKNMLDEGSVIATGSVIPPGVGAKETLKRAALEAGWRQEDNRWIRPALEPLPDGRCRGIGIASAFKNVGYSFGYDEKSTARVELFLGEKGDIERARLSIGASEVGMGVHTVLIQIAAETLGMDAGRVELALVDTSMVPDAGSSSASRHTYVSGNAVMAACREALAKRDALMKEAGAGHQACSYVCVEHTFRTMSVRPTTMYDPETGFCNPHFSYGYVTQIAEVAVDPCTGRVEVLRVISAQDVGRAINPVLLEGQVGGGVQMGLGYALMEEFIQKEGVILTRNFSEYIIPTALDMPPELISINVEVPDPTGPYGAKGVGEMTTLATAPAVLNAIRDACGVYVHELPAKPERVWRLKGGHEGEGV